MRTRLQIVPALTGRNQTPVHFEYASFLYIQQSSIKLVIFFAHALHISSVLDSFHRPSRSMYFFRRICSQRIDTYVHSSAVPYRKPFLLNFRFRLGPLPLVSYSWIGWQWAGHAMLEAVGVCRTDGAGVDRLSLIKRVTRRIMATSVASTLNRTFVWCGRALAIGAGVVLWTLYRRRCSIVDTTRRCGIVDTM